LKLTIEILAGAVLLATGCATSSTPVADAPAAARAAAACDAQTTCQSDAVASRDRAEYQLRAEEERDRAALMMTLMTSRPH